jgi:S-formylglutathione hydrolase
VQLIEDGAHFPELLIDQGDADSFLDEGLRPWLIEQAVQDTDIEVTLRMQPGYDHSYFFVATFMEDHLRWHASRLKS